MQMNDDGNGEGYIPIGGRKFMPAFRSKAHHQQIASASVSLSILYTNTCITRSREKQQFII